MNKSIFVKFAILASGIGIGFFVGKKYYEVYYATLAQEEIDSVKETFSSRHFKPTEGIVNIAEADTENGITSEEYEEVNKKEQKKRTNKNPLTRSSLDENPYEQAKKNYNLVRIDSDDEPVETDEPLTDAAGMTEQDMKMPKVDRTVPYIIDAREFMEEYPHHDKLSLYYYRDDEVLCDEHEEAINDIEGIIGYDAQNALSNETTVWVRNEPLTIDYEIIAVNKSYAEDVHGIGTNVKNLTPREKHVRSMKKRRD